MPLEYRPESRVRVFMNTARERDYWERAFGRPEEQIRAAIAAVGNSRVALARHFGTRKAKPPKSAEGEPGVYNAARKGYE
jgi:hypothetical protein